MNSKFFYIKASNLRQKNCITSLQNEVRLRLEGDHLDTHIVDYFQNLFSTNSNKGPMDFLSKIEPRVNEKMYDNLSRDFTKGDILYALKQMHPTKASGLDSMPPLFFQHH